MENNTKLTKLGLDYIDRKGAYPEVVKEYEGIDFLEHPELLRKAIQELSALNKKIRVNEGYSESNFSRDTEDKLSMTILLDVDRDRKLNSPFTNLFVACINVLCSNANPPLTTSYSTYTSAETNDGRKSILLKVCN